MKRTTSRNRGSALLMSLGVLALLAIMGTTFVSLMRMDSKMNMHYVDDVQCEMITRGMLEYVRGILSDDLDRSMAILNSSINSPKIAHRYENRDTCGPMIDPGRYTNRMAGLNTSDNVRNTNWDYADEFAKGSRSRYGMRLGIPPSNDFWLSGHYNTREMAGAFYTIFGGYWDNPGQVGSFYCRTSEVRRIVEPLTVVTSMRNYLSDENGDPI